MKDGENMTYFIDPKIQKTLQNIADQLKPIQQLMQQISLGMPKIPNVTLIGGPYRDKYAKQFKEDVEKAVYEAITRIEDEYGVEDADVKVEVVISNLVIDKD
jgi:hypothetical protein